MTKSKAAPLLRFYAVAIAMFIIHLNGLTPRQPFSRTASAIYQNKPLSSVSDFNCRNGLLSKWSIIDGAHDVFSVRRIELFWQYHSFHLIFFIHDIHSVTAYKITMQIS